MPYISLVPGKNCQQNRCQKPYSFQHQMSLSSNAELFKQRVRNAPISGNIDNPEGGFDALMQVREYLVAMFENFVRIAKYSMIPFEHLNFINFQGHGV